MMAEPLRAPYPYFGNKRSIADAIWLRLGSLDAYVEPFFGSGAVYFARPNPSGLEIVNDKEGLLVNAWRAMAFKPEETARWVTWPPSELDIISRHRWLMEIGKPKLELLKTDPLYCDPQIAAWYIFGLAAYVGAGWCAGDGYKNQELKMPQMSTAGIFRTDLDGDVDNIIRYFRAIAKRMRSTKITCGNWDRILGPACTIGHGVAGVVLDPPYLDDTHSVQYSAGGNVAQAVRKWAIENGDNPKFRIALCGYEAKGYDFPSNWETLEWKAAGGYANQGKEDGRGRENAKRERVWFSPHCLKTSLFHFLDEDISEQTNYDLPAVSLVPDREIIVPSWYKPCEEETVEINLPEEIKPAVIDLTNVKVSVVTQTNARPSPVPVLSKETEATLPSKKQKPVKSQYDQMSIFDLLNQGESNANTDN
jgi:DNA adenine methylase